MPTTRFELVLDHGTPTFQLRTPTGQVLLSGLGSKSKIMVQNEILHVRSALRDPTRLVPHQAPDGTHWVVLKDEDGSVLAKSPHVPSQTALQELTTQVFAVAASAPILDRTKHSVSAH